MPIQSTTDKFHVEQVLAKFIAASMPISCKWNFSTKAADWD